MKVETESEMAHLMQGWPCGLSLLQQAPPAVWSLGSLRSRVDTVMSLVSVSAGRGTLVLSHPCQKVASDGRKSGNRLFEGESSEASTVSATLSSRILKFDKKK